MASDFSHKFVTGKPFQDFLMAGYDALIKHRSKKWLSDDRSNSVLRQEDVEWGKQNWLPKCVAAGWKYWAIVQQAARHQLEVFQRLDRRDGVARIATLATKNTSLRGYAVIPPSTASTCPVM